MAKGTVAGIPSFPFFVRVNACRPCRKKPLTSHPQSPEPAPSATSSKPCPAQCTAPSLGRGCAPILELGATPTLGAVGGIFVHRACTVLAFATLSVAGDPSLHVQHVVHAHTSHLPGPDSLPKLQRMGFESPAGQKRSKHARHIVSKGMTEWASALRVTGHVPKTWTTPASEASTGMLATISLRLNADASGAAAAAAEVEDSRNRCGTPRNSAPPCLAWMHCSGICRPHQPTQLHVMSIDTTVRAYHVNQLSCASCQPKQLCQVAAWEATPSET